MEILATEGYKSNMPMDTAKIKRLRKRLKLTQAEAAQRAGLPGAQRWYHIESGTLKNPTLNTIERIAIALRCHGRDLLR